MDLDPLPVHDREQISRQRRLAVYKGDIECPELKRLLSCIGDVTEIIIITDAHHIGFAISELAFVTADHEHILKNKDKIIAHTNLVPVLSLSSFQISDFLSKIPHYPFFSPIPFVSQEPPQAGSWASITL